MCQAFDVAVQVECYHSVTVSLPTFPGRPKHEEDYSITDEASWSCLSLLQCPGLEFPLLPHSQLSTQKKESHPVAAKASKWCLRGTADLFLNLCLGVQSLAQWLSSQVWSQHLRK